MGECHAQFFCGVALEHISGIYKLQKAYPIDQHSTHNAQRNKKMEAPRINRKRTCPEEEDPTTTTTAAATSMETVETKRPCLEEEDPTTTTTTPATATATTTASADDNRDDVWIAIDRHIGENARDLLSSQRINYQIKKSASGDDEIHCMISPKVTNESSEPVMQWAKHFVANIQSVFPSSFKWHVDLRYSMIDDVSMFGGVHSLDLTCCDVTDVSALGGVTKLNLSGCRKVKDVSMLGGVTDLDLSGCPLVEDVSMLGGVDTLKLDGSAVTDVSMLGNVRVLSLTWCKNVKDVSKLVNVHMLDLAWCKDVTDVSMLQSVHHLGICGVQGVTDVSMLRNLKTLNIGAGSSVLVGAGVRVTVDPE